ncbi:MAG TPA: filamentous hemagglutinin N-terminal domain-containing protein, partial [Nevskiaceae bacterium]|nr:filamentous hemagglutinin N-terminal domain-containing protein [Nevskiaceae bacterium]
MRVFLATVLLVPLSAAANPSGVGATSGLAATNGITGLGTANVQVNQAATHAVINWNDFSIDSGELVQFNQPSATAAILNRVTGGNLSQIYGQMKANGRVLLVNPNGIVFGSGGQVDVGGLVASTLNITDANFNTDHWQFDGVADGNVPGRVVNDATINAARGGFVALLGQGGVQNDTAISADHGSILLAAGSSIFVDPVGDGLMLYQVTAPTLDHYHYSTDADPNQNDAGNDGVLNHGTLTADGGRIALETYNDFVTYAGLGNTGGLIRAQTASTNEQGQVILVARGSGVLQAGELDASGPGNGSVSIRTDQAAALRPPQDYGYTGDGNNPPSVIAHSFSIDVADFSPQRVTVAADVIDLRSSGDFNFGGVTVKGQGGANPASVRLQGNQLELSGVTLSSPALTLVASGTPSDAAPDAGRVTVTGSTLSGSTLVVQGANLDLRSTMDYATSIDLTGSTRITLEGATIGSSTPGAVSFTTPREAIVDNSTLNATTLTTQVGTDHVQFDDGFNVHNSTLTATTMQLNADGVNVDGASALTTAGLMDIHAGVDARGVPLHAGSLHISGGAFLEDDDVRTTAGMQFDSPDLQVRGTTLSGTTLAVNGSGTPSEFDLTPSATTGNAASATFTDSIIVNTGVVVIGDTAVHAPQISFTTHGGSATGLSDLFISGSKLDGSTLQVQATGIDIRGSNANAQSTLDFGTSLDLASSGRTAIQDTLIGGQAIAPVRITAGENLSLQSTTIHARDLTLRAAYGTADPFNGIFLTDTHLTGDIVWLDARGGVGDDFTNGPAQTMSSIDAQGLGVNGRDTGVGLSGTVIHVGTGLAPFGSDSGMLGELAALSPQRVPLSPSPNASFTGPRLVIGALTLDGDYLFLQSDNMDITQPVSAPTSLLVNLRPSSPRATI